MLKILFLGFLWLCFCRYFFYDNNFYQLINIFGKKGSGKTTIIAKYSQKFINKGYKVYSNVSIPGTYFYDPKDIGLNTFEPGSVVFLDEIGLIWHNRDYKNLQRCVVQWFKYQRHYKIRMYIFSQANDSDKVIRILTDKIYITRKLGKFSLMIPVNRVIDIGNNVDGHGDIIDNYQYGSIFGIKWTYLPRYYGLFDSFDAPDLPIINSVYQDYNEITQLYADSKKWVILKLREFFSNVRTAVRTKFKKSSIT